MYLMDSDGFWLSRVQVVCIPQYVNFYLDKIIVNVCYLVCHTFLECHCHVN